MQEAAGPGGADLVHVEVQRVAAVNPDVLRVLATDLEHGVYCRVPVHRGSSVGGDLVHDQISAEKVTHHVPSRSRSADAERLETVAELPSDPLEQALNDRNWFAPRLHVLLVQDVRLGVHQHRLGRRRADIHTEIGFDLGTGAPPRRREARVAGEIGLAQDQPRGARKLFTRSSRRCLEARQSQSRSLVLLPREQRRAQGAHGGVVGRHDQFGEVAPERFPLKIVAGDTADEHDRILDLLVSHEGADEIGRVPKVQACDDVGKGLALVLKVDHVRLGEHRAAARHGGWASASFPQRDEVPEDLLRMLPGKGHIFLVDRGGQSLGLLVDERSSAGGAGAVHGERLELPHPVPLGDPEQRGILSSHRNDGGSVRHQMQHASQLRDRLELVGSTDALGDDPAVVAGDHELSEAIRSESFLDRSKDLQDLRHEPAEVTPVGQLVNNLAAVVQDNRVDADRTDVDSYREHGVQLFPREQFRCRSLSWDRTAELTRETTGGGEITWRTAARG